MRDSSAVTRLEYSDLSASSSARRVATSSAACVTTGVATSRNRNAAALGLTLVMNPLLWHQRSRAPRVARACHRSEMLRWSAGTECVVARALGMRSDRGDGKHPCRCERNDARSVRAAGCAQQRSGGQAFAANLPGRSCEVRTAGARLQMGIEMREGDALRHQQRQHQQQRYNWRSAEVVEAQRRHGKGGSIDRFGACDKAPAAGSIAVGGRVP